MGLFNNSDDERFEFIVELTPRSAGDFGCVRIGGAYRSPQDCVRDFNEIKEGVERHVDGVDSLRLTISDVYGEYADISEWEYASLVRTVAKEKGISEWQVKWEDIEPHLKKATHSKEDIKNQLAYVICELTKLDSDNQVIQDLIEDSQEYLV